MKKQCQHKRKYGSGKTKTINNGFKKVKKNFNNVKKKFESYDSLIDRAKKSKSKSFKAGVIHFFDEDGQLGPEAYANQDDTLTGLERSSQQVGGPLSSNPMENNVEQRFIKKHLKEKEGMSEKKAISYMKDKMKIGNNTSSNPRVKNKFGDDIGSLKSFSQRDQRTLRARKDITIEGDQEEKAIRKMEDIPDEHYDEGYYYGDEE